MRRRLLLVEDDRLLCQAIRDRFTGPDLEVAMAHGAAEAPEAAFLRWKFSAALPIASLAASDSFSAPAKGFGC